MPTKCLALACENDQDSGGMWCERHRLAEERLVARRQISAQAWADVVAERSSQRAKGYTAEHDDAHTNGELTRAAIAYAASACGESYTADHFFPWGLGFEEDEDSERALLVKAAALLVAEIERLDRRDAMQAPPPPVESLP
jgi:hypothetical protein